MRKVSTQALISVISRMLKNQPVSRCDVADAVAVIWNVLPRDQRFGRVRAFFAALRYPEVVIALPVILAALSQRLTEESLCGLFDGFRSQGLFTEEDAPESIPRLLSSVGTGGRQIHTINVSTASAIIAASCGARVVRSGTKRYFGQSGANDFLSHCGILPLRTNERTKTLIDKTGLALLDGDEFSRPARGILELVPRIPLNLKPLFSELARPARHALMLLRPCSSEYAHRGISLPATRHVAEALRSYRGFRKGIVVFSQDTYGRVFDEMSIFGPTEVSEFDESGVTTYELHPEAVGLTRHKVEAIVVDSPEDGYRIIDEVFCGERSLGDPYSELLALNAGGILYAACVVRSIEEGVRVALNAITVGQPSAWLKNYRFYLQRSTTE